MLKVRIETKNDAFQDGNRKVEICSLLDDIKYALKRGYEKGNLHDTNGNCVGNWKLTNR